MNLLTLIENLPVYAKDIKLNLSSILMQGPTVLTEQQFYGTLLATTIACKNKILLNAVLEIATEKLSPEAMNAAKGAAALMAMNNIYYRFIHLASNKDYSKMPANLRMNMIGNPGIEKNDFELFSIAVSAIHGCGMCIDSHEKILLSHGITKEMIQNAIRVAAIIHAFALVLGTEN